MTMTMNLNKTAFVTQLLGFIAGINKHYAGATLQVGGQSVTAASLVTLFQTVTNAADAAKVADTQRTAAIAKVDAAIEQAGPMAAAFKAMVLAASGSDTVTLADFSLKPHKVPVVAPETRVAAAKKAAATRKALGTKGSKQKKEAKKALAAQAVVAPEPEPTVAPAVTAAPKV